ncbi:MAG: ribosomal small subunit protein bTHX [Candidatus Cloacimonas sp. 4484_143]|nr:MAG: ribosomal small subunit protein bTHX [Candidatus Cloacimonas sp. 4484_143]RLC49785.1 MAG: 30S ribosomal protein THX [Candidatus Cloacimonadota bacterium]
MGKGDRKSKKGKICRGSYGKTRKHQTKKIEEKKK